MGTNINYLLIESNKIKLGGYETISVKFLDALVDYLYTDVKLGQFLKIKYQKASTNGYIHLNSIQNMIHRDKRLLTSEESSELSRIYLRAYHDDNYAELVFIMFVTGCVNTKDLLCKFTDIGYIISKFSKKGGVTKLRTNNQGYRDLMACLIENTSEGIDYGFNVYDFIYHIRESAKHVFVVTAILKSIKIKNWSCFAIKSDDVLKKYKEEVAYALPLIVDMPWVTDAVMVFVLRNVAPGIQIAVLSDKMFVQKTYNRIVRVQ